MHPQPQFLDVRDGERERRLAMVLTPGDSPAIVWLGGFRSDMRATKAEALARWGDQNRRRVVRFDYSGHGESEGRFEDGTISAWLTDALAVIRAEAGPAPVLVGSSMGGWIALLAARTLRRARDPHAPSALVLIAPAVDFTQRLMWERLPPEVKAEIETTGQWLRPSAYSPEPYPITRRLIEDGRRHLLLDGPVEPGCPVTILQGMRDPDVPWEHAMELVERLPADSVTLSLVRDGDHRLSREEDIALLLDAVASAARAGAAFA